MGLVAVDHQDRVSDFISVSKQARVQQGCSSRYVPAAVRVKAALVVAARGLVICVVVLNKLRRVFWQRINYLAGLGIAASLKVSRSLLIQGNSHLVAGFFIVICVKVTIARHSGHVIHGRSYG